MRYIIKDWAGNTCFNGITFRDMTSAHDWLVAKIEQLYPDTIEDDDRMSEECGEYYIELKG